MIGLERPYEDELRRCAQTLLRDKQIRLEAADRLRKLQIKNINELYKYELISVEAEFDMHLQDAERSLIANYAKKTGRVSLLTTDEHVRKQARKNSTSIFGLSSRLIMRVEDEDSAADVAAILDDTATSKPPAMSVEYKGEEGALYIDSCRYTMGMMVMLISARSSETVYGTISTITAGALVVRLTGLVKRTAVVTTPLEHIRDGRVALARDVTAELMHALLGNFQPVAS